MHVTVRLLLLAVAAQGSAGHLCLLRPSQRGDLDISEAGSHTCFRHGPPCGGQPAEKPVFELQAGETFFFKWQQNYNHYEVGFPGYMDLSIGLINSTEFSFLAGFGDVNWHQQSHQQNYTVPLVVPDIDCKWCVLRARYVPHKPGEDTFYQCADLAISQKPLPERHDEADVRKELSGSLQAAAEFVASRRPRSAARGAVKRAQTRLGLNASTGVYGLACNPVESPMSCQFVHLTVDGMMEKVAQVHYAVDAEGQLPVTEAPDDFILDQISAYDGHHLYYLVHTGELDTPADILLSIDPNTGETSSLGRIQNTGSTAINALDYDSKSEQLLALQIAKDSTNPGSYFFRLSRVDVNTMELFHIFETEKSEDLYVNYQWSTVDTSRGIFYYLMGNENDAVGLTARLYAVNIEAGTAPEPVTVNASEFTLGSIQYDFMHSRLVALSPGLFKDMRPAWSVVTINSETGAVNKLCHVAPAGIFQVDYSGPIFNISPENGVLYARLRVADEPADVVVAIALQVDTCTVFYSQLGNFYHIHNMANVY